MQDGMRHATHDYFACYLAVTTAAGHKTPAACSTQARTLCADAASELSTLPPVAAIATLESDVGAQRPHRRRLQPHRRGLRRRYGGRWQHLVRQRLWPALLPRQTLHPATCSAMIGGFSSCAQTTLSPTGLARISVTTLVKPAHSRAGIAWPPSIFASASSEERGKPGVPGL